MRADLFDAWIAKLRDPAIPQTTGVLLRLVPELDGDDVVRTPTGFCCLGVLATCDHAFEWRGGFTDEATLALELPPDDLYPSEFNTVEEVGELASAMRERLGLPDAVAVEAMIRNDGGTDSDGVGHDPHTFVQIADWLESIREQIVDA